MTAFLSMKYKAGPPILHVKKGCQRSEKAGENCRGAEQH